MRNGPRTGYGGPGGNEQLMTVRSNIRLSQIASYIGPDESVCDVGTDHGYLPILLAEQGGHEPLIMSDVSKGSLAKAVADAREALSESEVPDARLGDGLDVLSPGEVDDVVIAGMGGIQILDILTWDFMKTLTFRKFIFQPRRDAALLGKWLEVNKFTIIEQCIVPENGRFSQIICAGTEGAEAVDIDMYQRMPLLDVFGGDPDSLAEYEYPESLTDPTGTGIDIEYYSSELVKIRTIADNILQNSEDKSMLQIHEARIRRLEELCRRKS